ncbi:MAG TPA: hypothetical protein VF629_03925 [Hymenobacter sp.]|jgi:hypothetical protein|uniref:hypothetical protein n=1 Tax=Hymenobacter sp. TaxID=1898978 RepID=UPI002ED7DCDC
MPDHSPATLAVRPPQRSLVVLRPLGPLVFATLLLGAVLFGTNALKLAAGYSPWRTVPAGLVGLGLLLGGGYVTARGNQPRLLTIGREEMHLGPLGPEQHPPPETIPLSSITAYTYWLRLLKFRAFAQYHLRLELADGRVLHLADRPGTRPDDPAGTVRLDVLAKRLARRAKTGPRRRLLFYQTTAARVLLWVSWAALAAALVLLWLGSSWGVLLLLPAAGYWASYYLGRASAELTE